MVRTRLWTKNFITGTVINFLLLLNYYLLMVVMTEYAIDRYHVSDSSAGLAASMFVLGALLARFFSAGLMERIGEKPLLILGVLLVTASSAAYFLAGTIGMLFLIRLAHGISYGMSSTAISTIVTGLVPEERHGEGIGYFMLSVTLGAAIGPFLGMSLTGRGGSAYVFMTCIFTALLCFLGTLLLRPAALSRLDTEPQQDAPKRARGLGSIFEKRAVPISLICAGIYFCYSSIISFLSPYAKEIHTETAAAFFFMVYSAVILLTRPVTGRLFDSKGADFVMLPAFLSFFAGMLLLSLTHTGQALLLSAGLLGFGIGVIQSCGLALAVKHAPPGRIAYVNATFYSFLDAGTGAGPFLLGFTIPVIGYRGMYGAMSVLTLLFALGYLLVSKRK